MRFVPCNSACFLTLVFFTLASPRLPAHKLQQEPPPDLVRRVAQQEAANSEERSHYAYRQEVQLEDFPGDRKQSGRYRETRDIIFSPAGERTERAVGEPQSHLARLVLTPEDFEDIRNIQPMLLTPELLPRYEVRFRGEENMDGHDCWVLQVRPRQVLQGMRLFDGMLWAEKTGLNIVRSEGQAVPPVYSHADGKDSENLFPRFVTTRSLIDGRWFPTLTFADDTLPFRNGPLRLKMTIRYLDYKRFKAESTITFEEK
jgi:hypothetical protein